jgi:hypothetical protein
MKHHGTLAGVVALTAALLIGSPASAGDPELKNEDLRKELRELREDLAALRIEESMARLSSPGVITRGAGAFSPTVPAATGAIRLDNRLAVPATVVIDGVAYSVPAFSMRTLPGHPARMITYEVTALGYGVRPAVRTPVNPNETLTLTIH